MGSQANGTVWEAARAEVWNSAEGWGAQKCSCTSSCEQLPGARPHLGDAQPWPPLLRSLTGTSCLGAQRPSRCGAGRREQVWHYQ